MEHGNSIQNFNKGIVFLEELKA